MPATAEPSTYFSTSADKKRIIDRLARIEGQLRGVQRMISEDQDCELVAQQLAAARGGLNKAFFDLIACAFETKLGGGEDVPAAFRDKLSHLAALLTKYA